ncbi:uncharacterized protein [Panulirus ornatus]|uniref:uncharacterized protein n=1 Tax=Panulirus ornatus TaxID=150431 RepID=UPI003A8695D7
MEIIDARSGLVETVRKLARGDLLIKVKSTNQVAELLKLAKFHPHDVVSIPVSMTSCKGVIYCSDVMDMSEDDMVKVLANEDVVAARVITKFIDGQRRRTPLINVTFVKSRLPDNISIGCMRCQVRPYISNPLRCFKCQIFGHPLKSCTLSAKCGKCTEEGHTAEDRTANRMCVNCYGNHSISDRACPRLHFEKEVCTVKTLNNISYDEARRRVKESRETPKPNESFASALKWRPVVHRFSSLEYIDLMDARQSTSRDRSCSPGDSPKS